MILIRIHCFIYETYTNANHSITGPEMPYGLALNLQASKLYWTDGSKATVEMANMDGTNPSVIISEGLQEPRDIEVDYAGQ